jgi:glycosyltransferase involved in cell wall biosynthesis
MPRETVAVVIPTLNVASFIKPTLESIRWADEIVIVDMFSDDGTKELVESYPNVRYFARKDYIFANVNYGMEQANTDWVIRLDSDEVLGEELIKAIQDFLEKPDPAIKTLRFRGVHRFFGFPAYEGVYNPKFCWRKHMFRKGTASYPCKSEHEDIETQEPTKDLPGTYDHYTNMTAEEVVRKFNYYTSRDVERLSEGELQPMSPGKLLYRCVRMLILYYIQQKGYKEGQFGFYTALFRGPVYTIIEQVKRWERVEKKRREGGS